ncbi:hypothetical protein FHR95_003266 [Halomonas fontilapidosi]|uniref:O-antigen ligase domain-containing protein n=1 Tax=Halomonas fontilapidosi TaxID=616675 RepID=A0A7W5H0H6_9GAMM|nr:hypothetical protein [Halomonas fontilapidosi]MBB3185675.1 hypothetical protein [Halomonas fontilapidosi]
MTDGINLEYSERPLFLRIVSIVSLPALIALVAVMDTRLAVFLGFVFAVLASGFSPVYGFPIILIGAALNNIDFIFGLHFGWILISGCALGGVVHVLLRRDILIVDTSIAVLIAVFIVLEISIALFDGSGRLDRLAALLTIMIFIAILGGCSPLEFVRGYIHPDATRALIYIMGSVGIILFFSTLSLLSTQDISMSRDYELGLSIGDTESSPRSLSNVLGLVVVTCIAGVITYRANWFDKLMWTAMGLIAFIGMFYTGSRMPVIATGFGLAVAIFTQLIFFGKKLPVKNIIIAMSGVSLISIIIYSLATYGPGVLPFVDDSVSDFRLLRAPTIESNTRLDLWQEYFDDASVFQLLFGSGIGSMGNPHSLFIGTLGAFGFVGVTALFFFICSLAIQAIRNHSIIALALLGYALLALSSSSDVDKSYFWVMAAVVILFIRLSRM